MAAQRERLQRTRFTETDACKREPAHARRDRVHERPERGHADALQIEVDDDGVGIAAGVPAGVGLVSQRERAAELGGTCAVTCGPEGGTRVRAVLPVH